LHLANFRLKYIDKPLGCFVDRHVNEPNLETDDVIMLTLDAEDFLEKSLYTIYREIPVRKLFVCEGGSKDQTLEILKKFPRIEIHVRPDFNTTGKALEFLLSLVETEWFVIVDADIELFSGWYDEMSKYRDSYDVLENSRRLRGYHFYREDKRKLQEDCRALDFCHIMRKSAVKNFHCEDDYMWRFTDILLRQVVENSGFKYKKIDTASHLHNETEVMRYSSDDTKNYEKIVFTEPQYVITNQKKLNDWKIKHAKAVVKYLDPDHPIVTAMNMGDEVLTIIHDMEWVAKNGPKWARYKISPMMDISRPVPSIESLLVDKEKLLKEIDDLKKTNAEYQNIIQSDSEKMKGLVKEMTDLKNNLVKEMTDLKKTNAEYQNIIQSDSEKMKGLVKEMTDLKKTNAEYQNIIESIQNSFTWRTLRKYDKIRDKALGRK